MYQPPHAKFVEQRPDALFRLMREYPFATVVTQGEAGPDVNHTPFLVDGRGKLAAHFPRANPVWRGLDGSSPLIVFKGPDSYISPSWYASKATDGRVVPTWNYAAVHVRGRAQVIEDKEWLRRHLEALTDTHERQLDKPWSVSDAPSDYVDRLLGAIVGIEVSIETIEGKFKLGQNRPVADQEGVARALAERNPALADIARW